MLVLNILVPDCCRIITGYVVLILLCVLRIYFCLHYSHVLYVDIYVVKRHNLIVIALQYQLSNNNRMCFLSPSGLDQCRVTVGFQLSMCYVYIQQTSFLKTQTLTHNHACILKLILGRISLLTTLYVHSV